MPQGWMMQASSAVVRRVSSIYESMGGRNLRNMLLLAFGWLGDAYVRGSFIRGLLDRINVPQA